MIQGRKLLLINGISETEEVLKAVLEPRGWEINRIRSRERFPQEAADQQTDVIVMHEDSRAPREDSVRPKIPTVIIRSDNRPQPASSEVPHQLLQQPFHYCDLIQLIEMLTAPPNSALRTA